MLARRRADLRLVENTAPHGAGTKGFLTGRAKWESLAATKALVNIHRDELGYFEWQRAVEAMINGCVVVSEHAVAFEPLVPGEHFVSASVQSLPYVLDALLGDEERLQAIRQSAYRFLRDELPLDTEIDTFLDAVQDAAHARVSLQAPMAATRPLPKPFRLPPPEWAARRETAPQSTTARMLKQVALKQKELERQQAKVRSSGRMPRVQHYGPFPQTPPRVSVVVSLYNYEDHVEEALESAALADYEDGLELVVVNDGSTDASARVATKALASYSWLPSKLVTLPHNRGLPAARNTGVRHSLGELIFILDADNVVYPHVFERLTRALEDDSEAAFAYGILEQFNGTGSVGLMSWLDWDPLRLAWGNYIDAAALIRRPALVEAGGYTTDPRLYGWEDFDLWCTFAERDLHAVRVPEIVARYRASRTSMISVTNIDTSEAWAALLERHPFLLAAASVAGE